jgi:hypothetical protein
MSNDLDIAMSARAGWKSVWQHRCNVVLDTLQRRQSHYKVTIVMPYRTFSVTCSLIFA